MISRSCPPASGTIQICGVFLFAAKSTSTTLNKTHLPSGEGTGSPTRFSFIMSSNVNGCLACPATGDTRRAARNDARRMLTTSERTRITASDIRAMKTQQFTGGQFREGRRGRTKARSHHNRRSIAPGIDEANTTIFEVSGIAGCEHGAMHVGDGGDLRVQLSDRSSGLPS